MSRTILHADMDAFYASIEQRDRPELRGRPVIVGGSSARGVVAAASYEARKFGVHSAMPSVQAKQRCPDAVFLRGDMAKYKRESQRIFKIFRRYTPVVEPISLDEAFLDLTGTERLLGPPTQVAQKLRTEVLKEIELAVSVGIAPVKMVAKIASDSAKPDGLLEIAPDQVRSFLDPLPVSRIWGVGRVAAERLEALGIHRIGDLARAKDTSLHERLGDWGVAIARLARGDDERDVEPYREAKSYGEENTFESDVMDSRVLQRTIQTHADAVARRLRRDELRAGGVVLKLKLARGLGQGRYPILTRQTALSIPTDDGRELAAAAIDLLERLRLKEPVRLVGVSAIRFCTADNEQLELPSIAMVDPLRRSLNHAMDQINDRYGDHALHRGDGPVDRAGLTFQIKRGED